MPTYKTRRDAREYLRTAHGVPLGNTALENMASDGIGPKYVLIAGRALYTKEWLDEWVGQEAARPVIRRRNRSTQDETRAP